MLGFSLFHSEYLFDDTKLHVFVLHFSVIAFVKANLTLPT
jgi:hypothetical protein